MADVKNHDVQFARLDCGVVRSLSDDQRIQPALRRLAHRCRIRPGARTYAPSTRDAVGVEWCRDQSPAIFPRQLLRARGEYLRRNVARSTQTDIDRLVFGKPARRLETEALDEQRVVAERRVHVERQVS